MSVSFKERVTCILQIWDNELGQKSKGNLFLKDLNKQTNKRITATYYYTFLHVAPDSCN